MEGRARYLMVASMDVVAEKEALFNEVYNTEHCPLLSQVPGVISVARFETEPLTMIIGGERRSIVVDNQPKHHALYEIEDPRVLTSAEWGDAVDQGRWPEQVRPFTRNRQHRLWRLTYPGS